MASCWCIQAYAFAIIMHYADLASVPTSVMPQTELAGCKEPTVQHGDIERSGINLNNGTYAINQRAEILCWEGYRVQHTKARVIHILCSEKGEWTNILDGNAPVPTCEGNLNCPLPYVEHGFVAGRKGGYVGGDFAPIVCDAGYRVPDEEGGIICQHDGQWKTISESIRTPKCEKLQPCPIPVTIKHGSYNILDGKLAQDGLVQDGTQVFFFCDSTYKLENQDSAVSICQNGVWMGKAARCVKHKTIPPCSNPPFVQNAYNSMYDAKKHEFGPESASNIVIYFCNAGYKISGEKTMKCQNGVWVGTRPVCVLNKPCPAPPTIEHGDYNFYTPPQFEGHTDVDMKQAYYFCHNGYKIKGNISLVCKDGTWVGQKPVCVKRTHCDPPMDIQNGNWIFNYYPDFRIGSRLLYECSANYKAIGPTEIECLSSGYWSDYAPRCLPEGEYCSEPGPVENGFFMCKPNTCSLFKLGTEVHYICNKDHEPRTSDILLQTCEEGGKWSGTKPVCVPVEMHSNTKQIYNAFNNSTITVVIATSCSVLGLLLFVMVGVILQRRIKPHHHPHGSRSRMIPGMPPPPPPYMPTENEQSSSNASPRSATVTDEHDRVALIQFADGVQVVLPSYDEAIRGSSNRHPPRLSRFNSNSSHGSQRSHGDYRPLPSIPSNLRSVGGSSAASRSLAGDRELDGPHQRDHHRNSIITTASTTTRDNLSLAFGSIDTMNVSDGTSTSITIGTYDSGASNPSIATSQRAAAGSLASSNGSLANDDAPLLERVSNNDITSISSAPLHPDNSVSTPIDEEPDKE